MHSNKLTFELDCVWGGVEYFRFESDMKFLGPSIPKEIADFGGDEFKPFQFWSVKAHEIEK